MLEGELRYWLVTSRAPQIPALILALREGMRDHRYFIRVRGPESRASQRVDSREKTERRKLCGGPGGWKGSGAEMCLDRQASAAQLGPALPASTPEALECFFRVWLIEAHVHPRTLAKLKRPSRQNQQNRMTRSQAGNPLSQQMSVCVRMTVTWD